MFRKLILATILAISFSAPALAQNTTCSDRPPNDSSNACANTRFVHGAVPTLPLSVPNGGTGQSSFTPNLPLIGNGTGPIAQGTRSGNTTSFGTTNGSLTSGNCAQFDSNGNLTDAGAPCGSGSSSAVFSTVAALNAASVSGAINSVTTLGYYSIGDGGGTTYVRVGSAPSLPCSQTSNTGTSFWDLPNRTRTNVKWCGAKGDGITNDTTSFANAIASAAAYKAKVIIPSTGNVNCYLANITIPDPQYGLAFEGDGNGFSLGPGSCINGTFLASSTTDQIGQISLTDIKFYNSSTTDTIKFVNTGWITLTRVIAYNANAVSGCAISLQNTAMYLLDNTQGYAGGGAALCIGDAGLSNSGPGVVNTGEYAIQGGAGIAAIQISGMPLGLQFNGIFCETHGPNAQACVMIDNSTAGSAFLNVGQVTFVNYHGESNYNSTTNTFTDFLIGSIHPAGNVTIIGGNGWGQGNGTNYAQDFIRLVSGRMVTMQGVTTSKLTATNGYSRSMIRIESSYTGQYNFSSNIADGSPAMYSDARTGSPLASWVQDASNTGPRLDGYWLVSNLPTCNSAIKGQRSVVIDATAPTYNGALTGAGTVTVPVSCNGTAWVSN